MDCAGALNETLQTYPIGSCNEGKEFMVGKSSVYQNPTNSKSGAAVGSNPKLITTTSECTCEYSAFCGM